MLTDLRCVNRAVKFGLDLGYDKTILTYHLRYVELSHLNMCLNYSELRPIGLTWKVRGTLSVRSDPSCMIHTILASKHNIYCVCEYGLKILYSDKTSCVIPSRQFGVPYKIYLGVLGITLQETNNEQATSS